LLQRYGGITNVSRPPVMDKMQRVYRERSVVTALTDRLKQGGVSVLK